MGTRLNYIGKLNYCNLLYKVQCFKRISGTDTTDNLTCKIIYDNFTCENYRFSNITNHSFWTFYIGGKPAVYIINRKKHGCLEIPDLFLVLNIFLTRSLLTREISCSTLEINLVYFHPCI